jgi:hypothetical protein
VGAAPDAMGVRQGRSGTAARGESGSDYGQREGGPLHSADRNPGWSSPTSGGGSTPAPNSSASLTGLTWHTG